MNKTKYVNTEIKVLTPIKGVRILIPQKKSKDFFYLFYLFFIFLNVGILKLDLKYIVNNMIITHFLIVSSAQDYVTLHNRAVTILIV